MDRNIVVSCWLVAGWVVPYVGTWIEIWKRLLKRKGRSVVPYVGTWIEI